MVVYPTGFLAAVKNYRAQHECSLFEAKTAIEKVWLFALLEKSTADTSTKIILEILIGKIK